MARVSPAPVLRSTVARETWRLQFVEHRQDQREAYPHYDRERYAHPEKVAELVTACAKNEQVGLIAVGCRKAHVGAEQYGQNKRFSTDAELCGDTDGDRRSNSCGRIVGHDIGHQRHEQHERA